MSLSVLYFGFASPNTQKALMRAVCGELPVEVGQASLLGFHLATQTLDQIPKHGGTSDARAVLQSVHGPWFESQVVTPMASASIAGTLWRLTPSQNEAMLAWELIGSSWQSRQLATAITPSGKTYKAWVDVAHGEVTLASPAELPPAKLIKLVAVAEHFMTAK